jgi:hypothetical protein
MDSSSEVLQRSLEALHIRQQEQQQQHDPDSVPLTDRSDGRADSEPSTRVPAHLPAGAHPQDRHGLPPPLSRIGKEGYGFRTQSGASTPYTAASTASPLPDPNGLGWPGEPPSLCCA